MPACHTRVSHALFFGLQRRTSWSRCRTSRRYRLQLCGYDASTSSIPRLLGIVRILGLTQHAITPAPMGSDLKRKKFVRFEQGKGAGGGERRDARERFMDNGGPASQAVFTSARKARRMSSHRGGHAELRLEGCQHEVNRGACELQGSWETCVSDFVDDCVADDGDSLGL